MKKNEFRFDAERISSLKQSIEGIKSDAVKGIATEILNNCVGGKEPPKRWPKVIAGHTKHVPE